MIRGLLTTGAKCVTINNVQHLFYSYMLQRIILYFALGLVLSTIDITLVTWEFWAILALFWSAERLTRLEAQEEAIAKGVQIYLSSSLEQQKKLRDAYQKDQEAQNDR
jgi:hypothetical protein